MPNAEFRFLQFTIRQDRCAMKVGTDALLFGGWIGYTGFSRILDIGTGTGVLALIAAQRNVNAEVHAVEIDGDAAEQARENAAASPWRERIRVHEMDVRKMRTDKPFDLIICNPPYYDGSAVSFAANSRVAKHGADLSFAELIDAIDRLLSPTGRCSFILPTDREQEITALASARGLFVSRRCLLRYVSSRPPKRVMLDMARYRGPVIQWEITVEGSGPKSFTPEARRLVTDLVVR